jgi:RHS repeat-associated protein
VILPSTAGSPCYDADFYPFGGERDYTNTCSQNYKFEGKERDSETNNDDFGARYYASWVGRWESPDWSAIPAPVPYANLTNPQTLNLYEMVSDNPETFADLDGHLGGLGEPVVEPSAAANAQGNQHSKTGKVSITVIVYYSQNLTGQEKAAADGQIAIAAANAQKIGVTLNVKSGGTVDPDKYLNKDGTKAGALNVLVGSNEDFSGRGSRSTVKGDTALIALNIAKDSDDSRMFQFELTQVLTIGQQRNVLTNAIKDTFFTPWLNAGLDGGPKQVKAANFLTSGGYDEMRKNAQKYSGDPET